MKSLYFFAPCPRGLESVLTTELAQLGATTIQASQGGVAFQGNWHTCYRANLESRIASRILWQVTSQRYFNEADIYNITHTLPWHKWFGPELSIRVNLAAIKCPLRSLDFATLWQLPAGEEDRIGILNAHLAALLAGDETSEEAAAALAEEVAALGAAPTP